MTAPKWTPMRWPKAWSDPALLDLLRGGPVNFVLVETAQADTLRKQAESLHLGVKVASAPPDNVEHILGDWPGTRLSAKGEVDRASAGPTGEPWIDTNGWRVQLAQAQHGGKEIWVEAPPAKSDLSIDQAEIAVADAALHGGRWIVTLDNNTAAGLATRRSDAARIWDRIITASRFFTRWPWPGSKPTALVGVLSGFSGTDKSTNEELLNLLTRSYQQVRVLIADRFTPADLVGLRTVVYVDAAAPDATLRRMLQDFADRGGTLVTGLEWGAPSGPTAAVDPHPRFDIRTHGNGRIATARQAIDNPYLLAQDTIVLMSHRYDLVRLWNGGAVRACLSSDPGSNRGLLQLLFYTTVRPGETTARVVGSWRRAKLFTFDGASPGEVPVLPGRDAVELHLPSVPHYAAVQLET